MEYFTGRLYNGRDLLITSSLFLPINDNTAMILCKDLLPWSKYLLYLDRKQEELTQAW